jgi:hypothetical protein
LTLASTTPGTFFSARSTRPTQDAQVMPVTPNLKRAAASPGGMESGVFIGLLPWRTSSG